MTMGVLQPLKDAFFDPSTSTLHWVHTAAEIVEAVEVTMAIIAEGATGASALTVAHWLHRVESVWATTSDIGVASGPLAGFFLPITGGLAAVVAEFTALGAPYAELAGEEVEKACVTGYSLGVVTGAGRERASMVERFMMKSRRDYDIPGLGRSVQEHRNSGLVRGYADGRAMSDAKARMLGAEIAKNALRPLRLNGGRPDELFYYGAAAIFTRLHIRDTESDGLKMLKWLARWA
jgi:hypothetical protein